MHVFDELRVKRNAADALSQELPEFLSAGTSDMEMVAFSNVRGAWEAHFKNDHFPDHRVVVSHIGHTIYTDVYKRITRLSKVEQDPLFAIDI